MPSTYQTFNVAFDNGDGTTTPAPGITLKIRDVTANALSSVTVTSNASGTVVSGTISDVAQGHLVRFYVDGSVDGQAGFVPQLTI